MSEIPAAVKGTVDFRDGQRCVRCGKYLSNNGSRHHRQRRRVGGHLVVNIILLCGSGTTDCHDWVHGHPEAARAVGLIVKSNVRDIASVPVEIVDPIDPDHPFPVLLTEDGQRVRISREQAVDIWAEVS